MKTSHPCSAGGMREVYRAKDSSPGHRVANKVLPAGLAANVSARERLRFEAVAAAGLVHPYICEVFEIGEDRRGDRATLFLVVEVIAGDTLYHHRDLKPRRGRLGRSNVAWQEA